MTTLVQPLDESGFDELEGFVERIADN